MSKDQENKTKEFVEENAIPEDTDQEQAQKDEAQVDQDKLHEEMQELKDKYLRLYAEFENYKKRTIRERLEMTKTAAQDTMTALLPVLDDFDRAKKASDDPQTEERFSEGVDAVYHKLYQALERKGLKPMESTGETFDAEIHEAIQEFPAPSDDLKGKVIDTVEKGYWLNDRIIRHAKVVVGK